MSTGDCDDEHEDEKTRNLLYKPHAQSIRREVRPNVATRVRLRQRLAKGKTRETGMEKKR